MGEGGVVLTNMDARRASLRRQLHIVVDDQRYFMVAAHRVQSPNLGQSPDRVGALVPVLNQAGAAENRLLDRVDQPVIGDQQGIGDRVQAATTAWRFHAGPRWVLAQNSRLGSSWPPPTR